MKTTTPDLPPDELAAARAAFAAGHHSDAVAAVRKAVDHAPDQAEASFLLCSLLLRRREPEAAAVFRRCLASFPQPAPGWVEVGDAFLDMDQREAALLCFARAPLEGGLAIRCGLLARDLGRRTDAISWFSKAVQLDDASQRGWFLLGVAAQDSRDFARAADAYRAVLALNPDIAEAEVNLGVVLQESGDLAAAKKAYARAVQKRPDAFARVAQALPGSPKGELWLDLVALRRSLAG